MRTLTSAEQLAALEDCLARLPRTAPTRVLTSDELRALDRMETIAEDMAAERRGQNGVSGWDEAHYAARYEDRMVRAGLLP